MITRFEGPCRSSLPWVTVRALTGETKRVAAAAADCLKKSLRRMLHSAVTEDGVIMPRNDGVKEFTSNMRQTPTSACDFGPDLIAR
jgi:hypothetical protein